MKLPRWFRLYDKKRGSRRTGSPLAGSVGEAIFFMALFLMGASVLAVLVISLYSKSWPASQYFPEACYSRTRATIADRHVKQEEESQPPAYRAEVLLDYEANGVPCLQWTPISNGRYVADEKAEQRVLDEYQQQETYLCWYDPSRPSVVTLWRHGMWGLGLTILVVVSLALIGGAGVIYNVLRVGTSAERRASLAKHAAKINPINDNNGHVSLPNVPGAEDITDSPGTTLAYRLPMTLAPGWRVLAAAIFCLLWNGVVITFLVIATQGHLSGRPDWLLTVFSLPFTAIGVWSLVYFVKELSLTAWIGPTNIEISDHPLLPGGTYEVYLSQMGKFKVKSLNASLVCVEETTFRQGTDIRNDVQHVYQEEIVLKRNFEVVPGKPFETRAELTIPSDAMHSMQAEHNAVKWRVEVQGRVDGWPPVVRSFAIVVHPQLVSDQSL